MRFCGWVVVILFVFTWTPVVVYDTDRHRFRYSIEPQCFVVLTSDLVKFGTPGYSLGHGVRDFSGVVAKHIPLQRQACLVRSPKTPVRKTMWFGNPTGQDYRLQFYDDTSSHVLPLETEARVAEPDGEHNCVLFAHTRAKVVWRNEDLCEIKTGMSGKVRTYHPGMSVSQCLAQDGLWMGGQEPVTPLLLRANETGKAFTGSPSAWAHVILGSLYFMRGIILSVSKISVVRVCINAFGNLYWMYSL